MNPIYILGINAFHGDSSACIIRNGILLAAAEEERFKRIKHWAGFPSESIKYCLEAAGISLDQITHVAINQNYKANSVRKIFYALTNNIDLNHVIDRLRNKMERLAVKDYLKNFFPLNSYAGKIHHIEHHLAHLSSAFYVSPYQKAVVVSIDGFGDFASTAWGVGSGALIDIERKVYYPHSLGCFYQALTQYIGFPNFGDEYKVMGLAPYGEPLYLPQMRQIVKLKTDGSFELNLKFFKHHKEKVEYKWEGGTPSVGKLFNDSLIDLLGPERKESEPIEKRHKDIARSVQAMYEEVFFHLLNSLHARHKLDCLAIAGGCAMNSVANGKILLNTPFKHVYVQAAAGDAGGAIGAAYAFWYGLQTSNKFFSKKQLRNQTRTFQMDNAYWGPKFSNEKIGDVLKNANSELLVQGCVVEKIDDEEKLCSVTAASVERGDVVGWFQGRMEWGPRALGNRSIIGDPRRVNMKDILNLKIKRRESFRPFAPSVLDSAVSEWFEQNGEVPFMMQVYQIKEEKRKLIPAVAHVDGSGRLQTVNKHTNPRYHALITAFAELTNVPMVLNTSFNENEPVVCTPEEALGC